MTTIYYRQIGKPAWRITCEAGTDLNKLHKSTQYILVTHAVYGADPRSNYKGAIREPLGRY
jgi:hypothetical protein